MLRKVILGAVASLALSAVAYAQAQNGSAAEARAMLEKAVAAIKVDKAKAIEMFNTGQGGFLDRDLYVFCSDNSTNGGGKIVALGNPNSKQLLGTDVRALKDSTGKAYGEELYAGEQKEGQFTEVSYIFVRPDANKTVAPKVSIVTKAGDLGRGVGYYK